MPKPIQVTDKNLNVQKASEGEVSFIKKSKKTKVFTMLNGELVFNQDEVMKVIRESRSDRFPVDDEHSQNKI